MSKIEWTEKTWNPVVGCSILSPGCTNCYAMRMAARIEAMGSGSHYAGTTKRVNGKAVWTGKLAMAPDHIVEEPLRRRAPTMYFVNSMSDLFHEDMPEDWIRAVFGIMARSRQHTFQILTKRAERMYEVLDKWRRSGLTLREGWGVLLPNVWLGVSAERQQEVDARLPYLINSPAAVRFLSAEPLLGPLLLQHRELIGGKVRNWLGDGGLNWTIVGGESGPNARPMHPGWARSLRDQHAGTGAAFFFKQWGSHAPASIILPGAHLPEDADTMVRTSKGKAGRLLDGRTWDGMPRAKEAIAA